MRRIPPLEVLQPENEFELLQFRKKYFNQFMLIAGGTGLIPELKKRVYTPKILISLSKINEYKFIEYNDEEDQIRIGALTTLKDIITSPIINRYLPSLSKAAKLVAMPQVRNAATIGGNICLDTRCFFFNQSHEWRRNLDKCFKFGGDKCNAIKGSKRCYAVFAADLPVLLTSLDAGIKIINEFDEEVKMHLSEFYTLKGKKPNKLNKGDILKEIIIDKVSEKSAVYKKFRLRNSIDFPSCSVAVCNKKDKENKFKNLKVVLGAVESGPVIVDLSDILEGKSFNDTISIEKAVERIENYAKPVNNYSSTPYYRKKMTGILFKKCIAEL